jgi:sucrose phosphorylase
MHPVVQLITYPDRLAGDLPGLIRLLDGRLAGVFGGVHVLPFFVSIDGEDAGFDPTDHRVVDPRVGTWGDVATLAEGRDVCADLIVNHVSELSPWFADVAERGAASPMDGMFLTYDQVFPGGATEQDLLRIYRPRPGLPFAVKTVAGRPRVLWTTFTPRQIDLDVAHPAARALLSQVMGVMSAHGVSHLRLDAVGYTVKRPGTSSFMIPETLNFIRELTDEAHSLGLKVLVEVHGHYRQQIQIAGVADLVYDFALPPLILHAVHCGDVDPLLRWLDIRPANAVTVLDTHDGIGVVDVAADSTQPEHRGLLNPDQVSALVENIHRAGGEASRRATGATARNLDVYQVNCTWYEAVGRDDARMLLTRLIQLFIPGIPQVYYVGLLAGMNDQALLASSGNGRDINRHYYTDDEIDVALRRPVVAATIAAIRFRNSHPAFRGTFSCGRGDGPGSVRLSWRNGADEAHLEAAPWQSEFLVTFSDGPITRSVAGVAEFAGLMENRSAGSSTTA